MARPLRIEFEGAFYHITSRGYLRDRIFFDDKDRETFLEILRRTKERYGYLLHAYQQVILIVRSLPKQEF